MYLIIVLIQIVLLCLQPPLVQAIFSGDPEEIRMLIHKTEDVNALVGDAMVLPVQTLSTFSVPRTSVASGESSGLLLRNLFLNPQNKIYRIRKEIIDIEIQLPKH